MKITLATKITIARIVLIVPTVIIYVLAMVLGQANQTVYTALTAVACAMFVVVCSTDFIDGYIARKTKTVSDLGKFLDPIADKVIVVIMLFLLVYHGRGLDIFPYNTLVIAIIGGLILTRELIVGAFRSIAAKKGMVLAADVYGKIKTILLDVSLSVLIMADVGAWVGWTGTVIYYLGGIMTIASGLNYVLKNKHVLMDEASTPIQEVSDEIQASEQCAEDTEIAE